MLDQPASDAQTAIPEGGVQGAVMAGAHIRCGGPKVGQPARCPWVTPASVSESGEVFRACGWPEIAGQPVCRPEVPIRASGAEAVAVRKMSVCLG
jgi:hypothetical protein